MGDYLNRQF